MLLRYSISRRKRLIDGADGIYDLRIWDPKRKEWITPARMTLGEHMESVPITDEEAARFMETGQMPEDLRRSLGHEMPDPCDE